MQKSGYIPVPIKQRSKFVAPDPWQDHDLVTWKLLNYEFVGLSQVAPGIATVSGTRYRILPLSVAALLDEGAVKQEQLPVLLHAVERNLRLSDYPPRRTSGDSGLAVILVALMPLWLAWEIGSDTPDPLFPQLVGAIGIGLLLLGLWTLAQGPIHRARERRLAVRFRSLVKDLPQ